MISFKKYYFQQFKDIPTCWKLAKKYKKYAAFICSILWLLSPMAICTMWLYDTGQMKIDELVWQESCRTFRSADELPHLPLVFNISYKEKLSFLVRNNLTIRILMLKFL